MTCKRKYSSRPKFNENITLLNKTICCFCFVQRRAGVQEESRLDRERGQAAGERVEQPRRVRRHGPNEVQRGRLVHRHVRRQEPPSRGETAHAERLHPTLGPLHLRISHPRMTLRKSQPRVTQRASLLSVMSYQAMLFALSLPSRCAVDSPLGDGCFGGNSPFATWGMAACQTVTTWTWYD